MQKSILENKVVLFLINAGYDFIYVFLAFISIGAGIFKFF